VRIATTRLEGKGDVVKKPTARLDVWAEAQRRFHLSDLHIQMARELGLNPKKFGGLATHRQEPWKLPLPEFIAKYHIPPRLMVDSGVLHTLHRT
jgi:hypothetical protein